MGLLTQVVNRARRAGDVGKKIPVIDSVGRRLSDASNTIFRYRNTLEDLPLRLQACERQEERGGRKSASRLNRKGKRKGREKTHGRDSLP